jgi:hypothetical protein
MAHLPDGATTLVRVIDCWVSTPVCTVQPGDESPDKSPNASGLLHFSRAKSLALDPHLFPHRSTHVYRPTNTKRTTQKDLGPQIRTFWRVQSGSAG